MKGSGRHKFGCLQHLLSQTRDSRGQRDKIAWLRLDREAKWTGYSGDTDARCTGYRARVEQLDEIVIHESLRSNRRSRPFRKQVSSYSIATVSAPLSNLWRAPMGNEKEKPFSTSGGASDAGGETWLFEKLPVKVGHVASSLWLKMCRNVCNFFRLRWDYATLRTHANCSDIAPWMLDGVITGRTPASVIAASKCKQTMYSLFNAVWWQLVVKGRWLAVLHLP